MSTRLDQASLAFPLRWAAGTLLLIALGHLIRAFDDQLADLEDAA